MKKIFTFLAATSLTIAANAESTTATFGSANNSAKDTQVTCPGFTIDGTYVASGSAKVYVYGSDKGMKMRANKNDNTLILSVNENTTITGLVIGIVTNDATQTLPISNVLVDGTSVDLVYPIDTYNTTNADGSAVITLTNIKATETIGIQFNLENYTASNKQVFIAGEVTYEEATEAEPTFPEHIDYTLNGEKELAGVTVTQGYDEDWEENAFNVSGKCSADKITIKFETPEGWDGILVPPSYGDDINPLKTRGEWDWAPLDEMLAYGWKKSNELTFAVDGEEQQNFVAFYKGDQVYQTMLYVYFTVEKDGADPELAAANQAAYEAVIAQLDALQEKYDAAVAKIKETNPDFDFSEYEEIPNMIEQYRGWAAQALASANEEGEAFMFPFDGSDIEGYISMMLMEADPAPEFPTSLDVTLSSNEGVELTVDDTQGIFIINVAGKSSEEEITITVAVPEGYDGFVSIRDIDMDLGIGNDPLLTRAEEPDWWPMSMLLEEGCKEGNTMTFPVDGEYHSGQFFLCKNGLADMNNQINVEFEVEYDATTGVSGVEAAENATFYDLQGNRIAKPAKGMYVKVADGKAMKVVVK